MHPLKNPEFLSEPDEPQEPIPVKEAVMDASEVAPEEAAESNEHGPSPVNVVLVLLGVIAFLYFARPVILPLFLAWMAATTLRPLVRLLSYFRFPTALSAAIVFCLLVTAIVVGFVQLGRPAVRWMDATRRNT